MNRVMHLAALTVTFGALIPGICGTITEDFSTDPHRRGWGLFGNAGLFQWDSTNQQLRVTWDSAQTNSYFYLPLGTILSRSDDFALSFDLRFSDHAIGTNPAKPATFEAAIGLMNLTQAMQTNFNRGAGTSSTYGPKNIVEFDFFPAFSMGEELFSPTIAQTIVSTNHLWLYNHDVPNQLDMTPGQWFHITLDFRAETRTLTTTVTNNGTRYGPPQMIVVSTNFDFRLTAFSISSYSEQRSDGSLLAHGVVDNVVINIPPPPVQNLTGVFSNGLWVAQFISRSNWIYSLKRSADFLWWTDASPAQAGNGAELKLFDINPPVPRAWYRVLADKP